MHKRNVAGRRAQPSKTSAKRSQQSRLFLSKSYATPVNITDYILEHTFAVPGISSTYTISTEHMLGLEFIRTLHEISPIVNGVAMELLVDFSIADKFHLYATFSKSYNAIAKLLGKTIDETFLSGEVMFSEAAVGLLHECRHIDNEQYRESYLSYHSIPHTTLFYILSFIAHSLDKFHKKIKRSIITNYLQTIVRNWAYFEDLCSYLFCIRHELPQAVSRVRPILGDLAGSIRFGVPCGFRTLAHEYLGEIDVLMNDIIIDVKCSQYPRYEQWSRQLHMYAYGLNVYNGLLTIPYNLCVINVYSNEILFFNRMESFDTNNFET